jgi:hypothetical protein
MVPELRRAFNAGFNSESYARVLAFVERGAGVTADFRISETPIFLSASTARLLERAANEVIEQALSPEVLAATEWAAPAAWRVAGDPGYPQFAQVDFALALDEHGSVVPRLIELQGFPSLYGFQALLAAAYREVFELPAGWTTHFGGFDEASYVELLRRTIVADAEPEQVVLLEIAPDEQKTRIDFYDTARRLGIAVVDALEVKRRGRSWYYQRGGREIPIRRVYNRVIVDEVERKGLHHLKALFTEESDIAWVGHPSWYFRMSKATLPHLTSEFVPACRRLSDLADSSPDVLERSVLKPFFSFAGLGVELSPSAERVAELLARGEGDHYLLQRMVDYAPAIATLDSPAKVEIRMMFVWRSGSPGAGTNGGPTLVNSLVRMSKGRMMGVDFNKNQTWVGASVAFHPPLVASNG